MKAEDLYEAMQSVRPEFLEECEMYSPKRNLRRTLFIAAAVALSSICVAAAVWSLREKAKADIGITQPISGWSEYDETEPEGLGQKNAGELKKTVTLDSSLCAGDQLDAYLRVYGVQPEVGASLDAKDGQYRWELNDLDYHSSCSIDLQHIAYEEDSQTALVRLHLGGLEDVEQVAVTLALCQSGETVVCCDPVAIPITAADTLHTQVDCALPRDNWMGEMRAVGVQVFSSYVEVEFEVTPLTEIGTPEELAEDGDPLFVAYTGELDTRAGNALADASLQYRDGSSETILQMPSHYNGGWNGGYGGGSLEKLHAQDHVTYRHVTRQAIDLSEVVSITIGGVAYPLS